MLELPESNTLARQMRGSLTGKEVASVIAGSSPHRFAFFFGDPAGYPALLTGRVVDGAEASGGLAELSLGPVRLAFGDGVNVRYYAPGEPLPRKHQLALEFTDGSAVCCTVSMYGGLWAFFEGENDNPYYLVAHEKPSPLADSFDEAYFDRLIGEAKPSLSAKALLATEQRIPGVGNGVLQDILYLAKINPRTPLSSLDDPARARLFRSLKDTLAAMTRMGGRDTERDLFGRQGGYRTYLSKNTLGMPCPVCGGQIVRKAYLGGNVYYCTGCQPVLS